MANEIRFHDFVEGLKKLPNLEWCFFAEDIIRDPNKISSEYEIESVEDRVCLMEVGKHMIPNKGYLIFTDNEFYDEQNEEFKKRFPEFKDRKVCATIEKVKDVRAIDSKYIDVTWEKYLIAEK